MPYVGCDVTGHISGVTSRGIGCASGFSSGKGGSGENREERGNRDHVRLCTTGVSDIRSLGVQCQQFVFELGRRITVITGDARETSYLRQRLSIAVQRGNAIACRGTMSHELDN